MFDALSGKLQDVFKRLRGQGTITEKNIAEAAREVRQALLEADVHFKVAKDVVKQIKEKAAGTEVLRSVSPGQQFVKIVHDELIELLGETDTSIHWNQTGPTVILMAGLQGSGKTTTCAKLARYVKEKGKYPLLVAADLQRPAAVDQLQTLGKQLDVPVFSEPTSKPVKLCTNALAHARKENRDVVILDTAGRLHVDEELMEEVRQIARATKPQEIFLVCDAMTGQDAVNSAKEFNDALEITGIVLTKLDGDARGGAALSIRAVTGKPIKFAGMGEKLDRLEEFHPDRMASRILGMGDVVGLVEKAQEAFDEDEAKKMEEKLRKAEFTLDDMLNQMQAMKKMGPLKDLLGMVPGMGQMKDMDVDENQMKRTEAILTSMTPHERRKPDIIDGSRRRRIAGGSGTQVQNVNELLKTFKQMKRMMKQMSGKRMKPGKGFPQVPNMPF